MLAALLLIQVVAGPPDSGAVPVTAGETGVLARKPCPIEEAGDDVVVCGRKTDPPRLVKLPEERQHSPQDMMTFRLPGHATGTVHGIRSELPGAIGSGGAVTLRIPFGKGRKE